jgi:hypothetical protein
MLTWLANDLAATNKDWVIAYWHHPPYTKGSHDSDDCTNPEMCEMRANALPVLEAGGVDLVLTGHSHSYERSCLLDGHYGLSTTLTPAMKVDPGNGRVGGTGAYMKPNGHPGHRGAVYAVAGSSGKTGGGSLNHPVMITSLDSLGSLVLDINNRRLDAHFLNNRGALLDSFTIIKAAPVGVPERGADMRLSIAGRPNPFSLRTRLAYTLPSAGPVRLSIYDVGGRLVTTLANGMEREGPHEAVWDGLDERGTRVRPGLYFSVLELGRDARSEKIVRIE